MRAVMRIIVPHSPCGPLATALCIQTMAKHLAFSLQEGEVDCWPLACPNLSCEYTALLEGECCPRCVSDPCLADNITFDIRKTCLDSYGVSRLSGSVWTMAGSPCTTCKCKVIGCPENSHDLNRCQGILAGGRLLRFLNEQVPGAMVETSSIYFSQEVVCLNGSELYCVWRQIPREHGIE